MSSMPLVERAREIAGVTATTEMWCSSAQMLIYDLVEELERWYGQARNRAFRNAQADLADLSTVASGFLAAYKTASISDEEGLLAAADYPAFRAMWERVDEAADELRVLLERP